MQAEMAMDKAHRPGHKTSGTPSTGTSMSHRKWPAAEPIPEKPPRAAKVCTESFRSIVMPNPRICLLHHQHSYPPNRPAASRLGQAHKRPPKATLRFLVQENILQPKSSPPEHSPVDPRKTATTEPTTQPTASKPRNQNIREALRRRHGSQPGRRRALPRAN